jgi:hypothetical protein
MNSQEYYIGIIAISYAIIISKFVDGIVELWTKRKLISFYDLHIGWIVVLIIVILQYVWAVFPSMESDISKNFISFVSYMIPVFLLQAMALIIFPKIDESKYSLEKPFRLEIESPTNKKTFYWLIILYLVYLTLLTYFHGYKNNILIATAIRSVLALIILIGIFIKKYFYNLFALCSTFFVIVAFVIIRLSPMYTDCTIKIKSDTISNNYHLKKDCFVVYKNEPFEINQKGEVVLEGMFRIGDEIEIEVFTEADKKIIQKEKKYLIPPDGKIEIEVLFEEKEKKKSTKNRNKDKEKEIVSPKLVVGIPTT